MSDYQLFHGDCLEVMAGMEDNSIDSIVCDPPAGISFMGKKWDGDKGGRNAWIAWMASIAAECLRVLKPGGHAFVWALPRTSHWTATAWEDAGFEVRERVAHIFGSGFPKSLNVGKQIDKTNAETGRELRFTRWFRSTGISAKQVNDTTGTFMGSHYLTDKSQPAVPTADLWEKLRPLCASVPVWVDELVERIEAEREIVGERKTGIGTGNGSTPIMGDSDNKDITAPATPEAKQWDGWGTALKPAMEDWWLFRKPLAERTVAANVLEWGTGAINVDGCRVGTDDNMARPASNGRHMEDRPWVHRRQAAGLPSRPETTDTGKGRWPANLILSYPEDEYDAEGNLLPNPGKDEVLAGFPVTTSGALNAGHKQGAGSFGKIGGETILRDYGGDTGSAARFFYVAKSSKRDRNEGCEGLEEHESKRTQAGGDDTRGRPTPVNRNHHPTVKPTALMRYLCKLVTPPAGTVLDPFCGSGSTGKGAVLEGFRFIGIEQDAEYIEIARRRIEWAFQQAHPTTGEFVTKAGRADDLDGLPMFGGEQ
jgi:DNA modification methylase